MSEEKYYLRVAIERIGETVEAIYETLKEIQRILVDRLD